MERIHFVLIYSEIQTCITVIISNYTLYLYCTFGSLRDQSLVIFPFDVKGQLISECLFDFFKFSKKPTKNLTNFCPRI